MKKTITFSNLIVVILLILAILIYAICRYVDWSNRHYAASIFASNFWYIFFIIKMFWFLCLSLLLIIYFIYKYKNEEKTDIKAEIEDKSAFKSALGNLKRNKLLSILCVIIVSFNFVMFTIMFSFTISLYDESSLYTRLLSEKNEYIIPIGKYVEDNKFEVVSPNGIHYLGARIVDDGVKENDINEINTILNNEAIIYKKYKYDVSFDVLLNKKLTYNDKHFTDSFKKVCILDNFDNFNQPLLEGEKPKADNEILVYDYVVESLVNAGIIRERIIGLEFYDSNNDISFKISGIIKSNYTKQLFHKNSLYFKNAGYYLNDLSTIYCLNSNKYSSIKNNFEGYYISLFNDWNKNKQIFEKLKWTVHDVYYYKNMPDGDSNYGYVTNCYLMSEEGSVSTYYLNYFATDRNTKYSLIIGIFTSLLSIATLIILISRYKNNSNKISHMLISSSLPLLAIIIVSFGISIPISGVILRGFSNDLGYNSLYVLNFLGCFLSLIVGTVVMFIGAVVIYFIKRRRV